MKLKNLETINRSFQMQTANFQSGNGFYLWGKISLG